MCISDTNTLHSIEVDGINHSDGRIDRDCLPQERNAGYFQTLCALKGWHIVVAGSGGKPHSLSADIERVDIGRRVVLHQFCNLHPLVGAERITEKCLVGNGLAEFHIGGIGVVVHNLAVLLPLEGEFVVLRIFSTN